MCIQTNNEQRYLVDNTQVERAKKTRASYEKTEKSWGLLYGEKGRRKRMRRGNRVLQTNDDARLGNGGGCQVP